ncbi:MAG: 16S rRNA (guanine(527)-N(7))-methyltransferase RsmG [Desulfobacteraceae bacterium]|nr:MAG: 16S rRNA (guanine(527)-N(7))-methyltransferase RsmG [Desulfobacteraceae bacterium]
MTGQGEALRSFELHARHCGIELSARQLELFGLYLKELMRWNEKMNLTGLRDPERIVIELFLDSLVPGSMIPHEGSLLDVGSGAGFPGLPLKILYPDLEVHLLESREKRVSFLRQVIRLMDLDGISVIQGRIERRSEILPLDCYRLATARAFGPFLEIIRWCAPALCDGGMLICYLGEHGPRILAESRTLLEEEKLGIKDALPYTLPGKRGKRHGVILRKIVPTQ